MWSNKPSRPKDDFTCLLASRLIMSCRMQGKSSACFPSSRRRQAGAKQPGLHLKKAG